MFWFVTVYLLLLILLNHFVCRRVGRGLGLGRKWMAGLTLGGDGLVLAHIMGRVLERQGWHDVAAVLSLLGDHWLLAMMWFVALSVPVDAWNTTLRWGSRRRPGLARLTIPFPRAAVAMGLAILGLFAWGVKEGLDVRLRTVILETRALPEGSEIRICQLSDLHLGAPLARARLERAAACVREARADLLALTGDVLDARSGLRERVERLASFEAPLGKFAVMGNHDFYAGAEQAREMIAGAGFRLLREEQVERVKDGVRFVVAGVDDPAGRFMQSECRSIDARALPREARVFTVLLKHQPMLGRDMIGRFNLQLSGHTHGGQVFPFHILVRMVYSHFAGLYTVGPEQWIYVSRGVGAWGPVVRFLAPPEVTLIVVRGTARLSSCAVRYL